MAFGDRVFSFWNLPRASDKVGWLLWLLGWSVPVSGLLYLFRVVSMLMDFPSELGFKSTVDAVSVVLLLFIVAGVVLGCWIVSGTYTAWTTGASRGRSWAAQLGALAILSAGATFWPTRTFHDWATDVPAIARGLLGLAILVLVLGGGKPAPGPATSS